MSFPSFFESIDTKKFAAGKCRKEYLRALSNSSLLVRSVGSRLIEEGQGALLI